MHKFRNLNQSTRSPLGLLRRLAFLPITCFAVLGCGTPTEESPRPAAHPYAGSTVTVAVVGDPTAGETVAAVKGDWTERSGAEVKIESKPIDPADKSLAADLFLFRGDRFADLVAAGRLDEIPDSFVRPVAHKKRASDAAGESAPPRSIASDSNSTSDPLSFAQIPIGIREQVLKFGGVRRALPYGGSALVLAYRREAFSDPALKAEAEKAGVVLAPPTTWDRLDELAKFLNGRDWDHDGTPNQGIALPLGEDHEGVGLAVLLARAASLGLHRDQFCFLFNPTTLEPWIDKPPFVEALSKFASLRDFGPERMIEFNAEAARAAFRSGKTAMLIDRAELASRWTNRKKPVQVGVAPLPGSKRVYDPDRKIWETMDEANVPVRLPYGAGLLIGVSAEITGKQREAALDLLGYLVSPDVADRIVLDRADPVIPVRLDAIARGLPDPREAVGVDSRSWAKAVDATWNATVVTVDPRLPNTLGYLADLDAARVKTAHGESAEIALKAAAKAWIERTNKLKAQNPLEIYRGGLNTVPTPNVPRRDRP
jgi:multiple sugar transport system substrate-binding protein